jgi:cellulose synthase/poly-beta-1,6-N-acetylglucosamine synthase-like glycosyltransferase
MTYLFGFAAAFVMYAYLGYPLVILLWVGKRGWKQAPFFPSISIVIAVCNEAARIESKIQHLLSLPYPAELREIIVVSDGSSDGTPPVLESCERRGEIRALHYPEHRGKAYALNLGVGAASGEIVVFNDARQRLEPDAVPLLLENFADPEIGCASGELHFDTERTPGLQSTLYWKFERWLRAQESRLGVCVGATGAFYAIRRSLFRPLPEGLILDDVFTPLQIALQGFRVVHDPRAIMWDVEAKSEKREFQRKVRTLTGNYQIMRELPRLLAPGKIGFQFFSHKSSRLLAPLFLILCLVSSAFLPGYFRLFFWAQCAFYGMAALGGLQPRIFRGILGIPYAFTVLNAAAVAALWNFLRRNTKVWTS